MVEIDKIAAEAEHMVVIEIEVAIVVGFEDV